MFLKKPLIGCDPEVFARDSKTGRYVSVHDLLPGDKREPYRVKMGQVQPDGLAAEFGILPATSEREFIERVRDMIAFTEGFIRKKNDRLYLELRAPTAEFSPKYFEKLPPQSKELGCDPDFDAYRNGSVNPRPAINDDTRWRAAGGHIHFGFFEHPIPTEWVHSPDHRHACIMLTQMCDVYLGVPSLLFDSNSRRRQMYGKAGSYRPKPYGMEYRSISNAWLKHDALMSFVYQQAIKSFEALSKAFDYKLAAQAKTIIDDEDTVGAVFFCEDNGIRVPRPPEGFERKTPIKGL